MNTNTSNPTTVALLGLNVLLAICVFWFSESRAKQFVLTPFYQVVPRDSVWTTEELATIQAEMPSALEARDMHKAYARLGSTLSIDDFPMILSCSFNALSNSRDWLALLFFTITL